MGGPGRFEGEVEMKQLPMAVQGMVSVVVLTCASTADAVSKDISAIFRPDPSKPNQNTFLNTTPVSGYCALYPAVCDAEKMFSIQLPIVFDSTGPIQANHGDSRQGAMFDVPATWRLAQVTHTGTGETEIVQVRISGIGSRYQLPVSVISLVGGGVDLSTAHTRLWSGSSWRYAPSPCRSSNFATMNEWIYNFFWKTPTEGVCAKRASYLIPSMSYRHLDFAYELRTPNPLRMSSGQYTGSVSYGVGPGQDFDMGDVMLPSDSVITLNFKLDIEHTLQVEVPRRQPRGTGAAARLASLAEQRAKTGAAVSRPTFPYLGLVTFQDGHRMPAHQRQHLRDCRNRHRSCRAGGRQRDPARRVDRRRRAIDQPPPITA